MKNHNYDERVIQVRRKINSYAFSLCYLLLSLSIIIKQFILNLDVTSYISELIIFFITSLYIIIASVKAGIFVSNVNKNQKNKVFIYGILNLIVILGITTILTTIKNGFNLSIIISSLIPISIISFSIMFVVFTVLDKVSKKVNENDLK